MNRLFRSACIASLVLAAASCGLLKKKGGGDEADAAIEAAVLADVADGEAPDTGAAPTPTPTPAARVPAANENDIARFPDETKLADVAVATQRQYNVREAPPAGTIVTSLAKGTNVVQVAQRGQYFIIEFDDPKTAGQKMMGWVHADAFSAVATVDAGIATLKCPTGEIALFSDTPFCGKLCQKDSDCPTTQACKGQANKLTAQGKAGDGVTVCTVFHPHVDAGAPTVVDAGAPKVDAGVVDAGGLNNQKLDAGKTTPPPPAPAGDVTAPTGGQCPTGFSLVAKTGKCHRQCPTVAACKPTSFCIKCDADQKRVCGESRDQCK